MYNTCTKYNRVKIDIEIDKRFIEIIEKMSFEEDITFVGRKVYSIRSPGFFIERCPSEASVSIRNICSEKKDCSISGLKDAMVGYLPFKIIGIGEERFEWMLCGFTDFKNGISGSLDFWAMSMGVIE